MMNSILNEILSAITAVMTLRTTFTTADYVRETLNLREHSKLIAALAFNTSILDDNYLADRALARKAMFVAKEFETVNHTMRTLELAMMYKDDQNTEFAGNLWQSACQAKRQDINIMLQQIELYHWDTTEEIVTQILSVHENFMNKLRPSQSYVQFNSVEQVEILTTLATTLSLWLEIGLTELNNRLDVCMSIINQHILSQGDGIDTVEFYSAETIQFYHKLLFVLQVLA